MAFEGAIPELQFQDLGILNTDPSYGWGTSVYHPPTDQTIIFTYQYDIVYIHIFTRDGVLIGPINTGVTYSPNGVVAAYNPLTGHIVFGDSKDGFQFSICTVTVGAIAFSSPSTLWLNTADAPSMTITDSGKVCLVSQNSSGYSTLWMLEESGGSVVLLSTTQITSFTTRFNTTTVLYNPDTGKLVIGYRRYSTYQAALVIGTISGTAVSFSSPTFVGTTDGWYHLAFTNTPSGLTCAYAEWVSAVSSYRTFFINASVGPTVVLDGPGAEFTGLPNDYIPWRLTYGGDRVICTAIKSSGWAPEYTFGVAIDLIKYTDPYAISEMSNINYASASIPFDGARFIFAYYYDNTIYLTVGSLPSSGPTQFWTNFRGQAEVQ